MKPASVVGSIFAAVVFVGVLVAMTGKTKKPLKPAAGRPAAAQKNPAFESGFAVGFLMAKTGEVKPSADRVDAMARKQALEAGTKDGTGYAHNWKTGFWMGWSKGD